MIKFHPKYFFESNPFENVNPGKIRSNGQRCKNIDGIENKSTRFQIYRETEVACKYTTICYKTQYSENLVEYEKVLT